MKKRIGLVLLALMLFMTSGLSAFAASGTVISLKLSKTSMTLTEGKSEGLSFSYSYSGTISKTKKWTSSNTKVATVNNGVVKAVKPGTATITLTFGGKKATCKVTVKAAPAKFLNVNDAYTIHNNYRKKAKVATLKKDAALEKIAQTRAKEMAINNKFSHTRPNGKSGLSLIPGNVAKGENIAKGQTSCKAVMTAWYNSKGHKANILRKNFKKIGIACYTYKGVNYWVAVFSS